MLDTIDAMIAFAGTPGGMATMGLAAATMLLVRRGAHNKRRRTD